MYKVACSRFNNETWGENADWRRRHNHPGCIYGSPSDIAETTTTVSSTIFVIEMNNDTNRVMGVGKLVIDAAPAATGRRFNVYGCRNYNRYKFVGRERVDRETDIEPNPRLSSIFNRLDYLLFRNARHCKRGSGIQSIPRWITATADKRCNFLLWRFFAKLFAQLFARQHHPPETKIKQNSISNPK